MKKFIYVCIAIIVVVALYVLATAMLSKSRYLSVGEESGSFLKNVTLEDTNDYLAAVNSRRKGKGGSTPPTTSTTTPTTPPSMGSYTDQFTAISKLEEAGSPNESRSSNWWVNSGAWLLSDGTGKTVQGDLLTSDRWYSAYLNANPEDTDKGLHPQNIFRLVQRGDWSNLSQEAFFRINKLNLSSSSNRNASNGLFLFNRYQSGDNLYYTGLRVDGAVVIKKKINGTYYTLAYKSFFSGTYNRDTNSNLLPLNSWIGLKSEVITNTDGTVTIRFYVDAGRTGVWKLALEAKDDNTTYGGASIVSPGFAGIRTDFMDVEFDDYSVKGI